MPNEHPVFAFCTSLGGAMAVFAARVSGSFGGGGFFSAALHLELELILSHSFFNHRLCIVLFREVYTVETWNQSQPFPRGTSHFSTRNASWAIAFPLSFAFTSGSGFRFSLYTVSLSILEGGSGRCRCRMIPWRIVTCTAG